MMTKGYDRVANVIATRVVFAAFGVALVVWTLGSAIKTVVLPPAKWSSDRMPDIRIESKLFRTQTRFEG